MANTNILVVHPDVNFHHRICEEISKLSLNRVCIDFSRTGREACVKFNRIANSISLVLFNPNTPWVGDLRKTRCVNEDFLRHIKAPCQEYRGEIVLVSDGSETHLNHAIVNPNKVVEFISSFVEKKNIV